MKTQRFSRLPVMMLASLLAVFCCRAVKAESSDEESKKKRDSTSLKLKRQTTSTQNQGTSGSPLANAVAAAGGLGGELFGPGEIQVLGYGTGGYGQSTHDVTEEKTVKQTTTVTETHFVTKTTYQATFVPRLAGPGGYVLTPVQTTVPVTTQRRVTTNVKVKTTKNVAGIQGGFGGAGAEARYFFTRWLGVGVEGDWLEGEGSSGLTLTTITARLVRNANAYYVFGGAGVQYNDEYTQAIGKLGLGVEHRFVAGTGVFADAAWMFGSQENAAILRGGFRFKF